MEGNFLEGKPQNAIPSGYENDSVESITFPNHVIAERCCQTVSARPQGVAPIPVINIILRHEEETIKVYVLAVKHMSADELQGGLEEEESVE